MCQPSVAGSPDSQGILTLYNAQFLPYMEYGASTWMPNVATHTRRLDAVQRRAVRLLWEHEEIVKSIMSLDHRSDVATLTVCHKAWVQHTPHLTRLNLPLHPLIRKNDQANRGRRPPGAGASLPFLITPVNLQSQGRASVESLLGGHTSSDGNDLRRMLPLRLVL